MGDKIHYVSPAAGAAGIRGTHTASAQTWLAAVSAHAAASAADNAAIMPVPTTRGTYTAAGILCCIAGHTLSNVNTCARIAAAGASICSAETWAGGFTALPDNFTGILAVLTGNLKKECFAGGIVPNAGNSWRREFPHTCAVEAAIKTAVAGKAVTVRVSAGLRIKIIKDPVPDTISRHRGCGIGTGGKIGIGVIDNG